MISSIISRLVILVFGTLYPAYASYKAVRTKNLKEYVKWMMYWIVFALFTCTETFTDVFLSWFPFYYEVKIVIVLWLLSPATKGSSILYRKFVHPALCRREQEIDEYIAKAKDQGYHTVLNLGTKGVNYATTVIMQTAIKGGGGLVQQIRKSYSLSDLTECDPRDDRSQDEADDVLSEPHLIRRNTVRSGYNTRRSASESNSRAPLYFPEVDVDVRSNRSSRCDEPDFSHIKSSEDISSGYSSADNSGASLTRTASVGAAARARKQGRTTVTSIKRPQAAEDSEVIIEELQDDDNFEYATMPPLLNVPSPLLLSHTDPPFIYQYVGDQVRIVQVLRNPLNEILNANVEKQIVSNDTNDAEMAGEEIKKSVPTTKEVDKDKNNNDPTCSIQDNVDKDLASSSTENNEVFKDCEKEVISDVKEVQCEIVEEKSELQENENTLPTNVSESIVESKLDQDTKVTAIVETEEELKSDEIDKVSIISNTVSDTLQTENDSAESDDEASFGTPENSPKSKRKLPKGKYGKGKAPPPPPKIEKLVDKETANEPYCTSLESLLDSTPPPFKDPSPSKTLVVNPISEKKRRHKSKSPYRIPKTNASSLGKLLQLPGKLAFWHKVDKGKSDSKSVSDNDSRRSSTIESTHEDFPTTEVIPLVADERNVTDREIETADVSDKNEDSISFKDASDFESEVVTQDIMDKSDALQKLIEAKIESHPEYKFVAADNDEMNSTSKSTDV